MQRYDFQNSIGFIVNQTAKGFVKALDLELRQKVGVTVSQWKVMVICIRSICLLVVSLQSRIDWFLLCSLVLILWLYAIRSVIVVVSGVVLRSSFVAIFYARS
jgi:hypothetical protein